MYNDHRYLEFEIKQHTDSDENIIWIGKPKQGIFFKGSDAFMIPFSLMWGGFAFFWEFTVINSGAPFIFILWGLPFVMIGLYLIFGRFFYDSARRKSTIYCITEGRIIIKSGVFKKSIKSINIRTLSDITFTEKVDGSGTIVLGSEVAHAGMLRGTGWPASGRIMVPSLEMIPDVRQVYKQLSVLHKVAG